MAPLSRPGNVNQKEEKRERERERERENEGQANVLLKEMKSELW